MIIPELQSEASTLMARAAPLVERYTRTCRNSYGQYTSCRSSSWGRFGRWVLVGVLILAALFVLLVVLCCMRRRRSRAAKTATPMANTNTGYDNNPGYNNNGAAYAGNTGYNNGPAYGGQAQYAPPNNPPPQQYGGGNEGYYGQQNGVAQPQGAYMK